MHTPQNKVSTYTPQNKVSTYTPQNKVSTYTPQNKLSTYDKFQKKSRAACSPFALCTVSTNMKFYLNILLTIEWKRCWSFNNSLICAKIRFSWFYPAMYNFLRNCQGNWNRWSFGKIWKIDRLIVEKP